MCLSKQENVDAILVGLEKTACLIDRCAIYESLCTDDSAASKNLEKSILRLYTAILKFLANAVRVLNGELEYSPNHNAWSNIGCDRATANFFSDNLLKAVFRTVSNYFAEVEQLEETVGRDASVAEAQCIVLLDWEKEHNVDSV